LTDHMRCGDERLLWWYLHGLCCLLLSWLLLHWLLGRRLLCWLILCSWLCLGGGLLLWWSRWCWSARRSVDHHRLLGTIGWR